METKKVYVNLKDHTAVLKCPHCGTEKRRYVGKFKGGKRDVKVKCTCQMTFSVLLEYRRFHRKETDLKGYYAKLPATEERAMILILNVSPTGLAFLTHNMHTLNKGDILHVRFNLDDRERSLVTKRAIVRWVEDGNVGCEFMKSIEYEDTYDTALNFYLMP